MLWWAGGSGALSSAQTPRSPALWAAVPHGWVCGGLRRCSGREVAQHRSIVRQPRGFSSSFRKPCYEDETQYLEQLSTEVSKGAWQRCFSHARHDTSAHVVA